MMKIGVVYPQTEFSADPAIIKEYAQTVEELGYSHILIYDHVLGANPNRADKLTGPYTYEDAFMEPFVLFSYMASITKKIEFTTGILILPQRQTALVAKQAATLDILSGGRLRLGVGLGWNHVEYHVLNEDFHIRGRRIEEQVFLLRKLWSEPLVKFEGKWDSVPDAGINPLPHPSGIPIWFGGHHENVLRRVGAIGDGWMPNTAKAEDARPLIEKIEGYLEENGRSRSDIGIEWRLWYGHRDPAKWLKYMDSWQGLGASHMSINTMNSDLESPEDHIKALSEFASVIGL